VPDPRREWRISELESSATLRPFMPRLQIRWLAEAPGTMLRELDGTVVFVDISGFTKMSERLARKGKVGAEEVTDVLGAVFTRLLSVAYGEGGGLIKFGGDALLLWFSGNNHAIKGARAAYGMRALLRELGPIQSSAGKITLRMSVGVHSGTFQVFLVGDSHRELLITGPSASQTVAMESTAGAGEILVSRATATLLPEEALGKPKGEGVLLRRAPQGLAREWPELDASLEGVDLVSGIPLAIREHVLSGAADPEHRQVTVAFVHFDGIDGLLQDAGPEVVAYGLDQLVREVQAACEKHRVTFLGTDIDKDGGKIILVAGTPQALGDDEERLLLTLRAIIEAETNIPVRIGVNRGHVFAGDIGPPYRRTYTVMGDAVNLAARVMAKAEPGQLLATDAVLDASPLAFNSVALEPFMVKGKSQPVHAFVVGHPTGAKATEAHDDLPLVGREREIEVFRRALEDVRRGHGSVIELVGDPGIGKTRLLTELRAMASDLPQLAAGCELYEDSTPYLPFRRLFRLLLGATGSNDSGLVERLGERVEAVSPELLPWIPLLAVVADVEVLPTPEVERLDEEFRKTKLEDVTAAFLRSVITEPSVMAVEDVHWMDEGSSDLLRHIARNIRDVPWLVCVTRRDEETGFSAPQAEGCASLHPEPLDHESIQELINIATENSPLRPHVVAALTERSGGNPLFLRELLRAGPELDSAEHLPTSVEAMVMMKIDRLPPPDRRLLRYASVLGMSFADELLDPLFAGEQTGPAPGAWRRLAEFVEDEGGGLRRFRHALMRQAAYEGLPYRRRRELHARVGEAIERGAGEDVGERPELLSMHFFHAGRFGEAWLYSRMAGERAHAKYANTEAAAFFLRALEAARRVGVDARETASIYEALGDVLKLAGEYGKAGAAYGAARRLVGGEPVKEARLLLKRSKVEEKLGRYPQALRWVTRARRVLGGAQDEEAKQQAAQLTAWYATVLQAEGRTADAVRWARVAEVEAEAANDREALARAYNIISWAHGLLGRSGGREYGLQALRIYEELQDLVGQASMLNNLGAAAYFEGSWNEALDLYQRAYDATLKVGDPVGAAACSDNIAEVLSDQGRLEEAEVRLRQTLRVWKAAEDRYSRGFCLSQLGRVVSRRGRFAEALELFDLARAEFLYVGAQEDALDTEGKVAECLLLMGDEEAALARSAEALSQVETRGVVGVAVPLLQRVRAYALIRRGELEEARDALEKSLQAARERRAEYEVALTLRALGKLALAEGRDPAVDLESESRSILDRLDVVSVTEVPILQPTGTD
jgi:class 3 adenylate cyclase/tetratricopeptide (TPR) repeat protein